MLDSRGEIDFAQERSACVFVLPKRFAKKFDGNGSAIGLHARPIDFAEPTAAY